MKEKREIFSWLVFSVILIGIGSIGLYGYSATYYCSDEEYFSWQAAHNEWYDNGCSGEPPPDPGYPISQKAIVFWSSLLMIIIGALLVIIPIILRF